MNSPYWQLCLEDASEGVLKLPTVVGDVPRKTRLLRASQVQLLRVRVQCRSCCFSRSSRPQSCWYLQRWNRCCCCCCSGKKSLCSCNGLSMSVLPFEAADGDRGAPGEGRRGAHGRTELLHDESHFGSGRMSAASDWAGGDHNNCLYVINRLVMRCEGPRFLHEDRR